ncbi:DUF3368 domain-containing protein [Halorhabdus sp. BNX81]|uniref:DUF3368 domain-containing protein n=1 Tax=Halorhabdus sp. BNX81 TaxID=2980181 RepID=UPI0023DCF138|nr:DUF3368 domain-containing protein [Halorhabdus sp. BNX81]WEL22049.1 DUF3368 domain-containing protein [Halorhabdus sp. BNX81]
MHVFDATPLIYLATVDRLGMLTAFEDDRLVPERVYDEVVTVGLEAGHADARRVERAVEDDVLTVATVERTDSFERLAANDSLSEADAAVLALAAARDGTGVMDGQYGRDVAAAEGIETRGTAYLVLRSLKRDAITAEEARETIDAMVDAGWYGAPDLYAKLLRRIEDLA